MMFGTKKRTYGSKKAESGIRTNRDILRAFPDNTNLFDALSAINIKKYRKDNSYLYPNNIEASCRKRRVQSKPVKLSTPENTAGFLNSSSDISLHVKHDSNDLFDQLVNSSKEKCDIFDNVASKKEGTCDPILLHSKINLTSDSSSYSPVKSNLSVNEPANRDVEKRKRTKFKKKITKGLPKFETMNSSSVSDHFFHIEPINGKTNDSSKYIFDNRLLDHIETSYDKENDESRLSIKDHNKENTPINLPKVSLNVYEKCRDNIKTDFLLNNVLSSTPLGKSIFPFCLQDKDLSAISSSEKSFELTNKIPSFHIESTQNDDSKYESKNINPVKFSLVNEENNLSNNDYLDESVDPKLLMIPVVQMEKLISPLKLNHSLHIETLPRYSENDDEMSFYGFSSKNETSEQPFVNISSHSESSPNIFGSSCEFSDAEKSLYFDIQNTEQNAKKSVFINKESEKEKSKRKTFNNDRHEIFSTKSKQYLLNENLSNTKDNLIVTLPVIEYSKHEEELPNDALCFPTYSKNISHSETMCINEKISQNDPESNVNKYDIKLSKMLPKVILSQIERISPKKSESNIDRCLFDDEFSNMKDDVKLTTMVPKVMLSQINISNYQNKLTNDKYILQSKTDCSKERMSLKKLQGSQFKNGGSTNVTTEIKPDHSEAVRIDNCIKEIYKEKDIFNTNNKTDKLLNNVHRNLIKKIHYSPIRLRNNRVVVRTNALKITKQKCRTKKIDFSSGNKSFQRKSKSNDTSLESNIVSKQVEKDNIDTNLNLVKMETNSEKNEDLSKFVNTESTLNDSYFDKTCVFVTKRPAQTNSEKTEDLSKFVNTESTLNDSYFDKTCVFVTKRPAQTKVNSPLCVSFNSTLSSLNDFKSINENSEFIDQNIINLLNDTTHYTKKRSTMFMNENRFHDTRSSIILEPGKRWERSLNILRNINKSLDETYDSANSTIMNHQNIKGRKYRQSVAHLLDLQTKDGNHGSVANFTRNFHDTLSTTRRFSVMIVEEPTLQASDLSIDDTLNISQIPLKNRLLTDTCNDTEVSLSRLAISEVDHNRSLLEIKNQVEPIWSGHTARDVVLRRCNQIQPLPFDECYPDKKLQKCCKIGEGVYGEVFLYKNEDDPTNPIVMKVIPIEGTQLVNGDRQKTFQEIISEIVIAMELSDLRNKEENNTFGFNRVNRVRCVKGRYPARLIELWELFDELKGSENDCPTLFDASQLYIILELANGGKDLEAFVFADAEQSYYLFYQIAFALAVAEEAYQFEHRDLHWGNILITSTDNSFVKYCLRGETYSIPTGGVCGNIIDFTLSRITLPGASTTIFNNLAKDPDLFNAEGDYQFDIYRLMREKNGDQWHRFEPYTNILWLHYTLDKMITALRYQTTDTRIHQKFISKLTVLKENILQYDSCVDFVTTECFAI